jgi:hypothetical protein
VSFVAAAIDRLLDGRKDYVGDKISTAARCFPSDRFAFPKEYASSRIN